MNKILIKKIVFNVLEVYLIGLIGYILKVPLNFVIMFFLLFFIIRLAFGQALHYKKMYLCSIWSTAIFLTIYFLFHADIFVSILWAVFCALITSGKSNIFDMFMWKPKTESKYKLLDEFLTFNIGDVRVLEYEKYLKENEVLMYNLFRARFREHATWAELDEQFDYIERNRLNKMLDIMYHHLKVVLNLRD